MRYVMCLFLYCSLALLPSCQWFQQQQELEHASEEIMIEAAKKEVTTGNSSLEEDVLERKLKAELEANQRPAQPLKMP